MRSIEWWNSNHNPFTCKDCNKDFERGGFTKDGMFLCWKCFHGEKEGR